jgi:hypothetical protein
MDEVIATFNKNGVRYLLIGAQAVRLHGMPRYSFDWDFYVPAKDEENFKKINLLLAEDLDMPLLPLGTRGENFIQTYQTKYGLLQFHLLGPGFPPFEEAERDAAMLTLESGTNVRCVSAPVLLRMKEASNRAQDQADILYLRAVLHNS